MRKILWSLLAAGLLFGLAPAAEAKKAKKAGKKAGKTAKKQSGKRRIRGSLQ